MLTKNSTETGLQFIHRVANNPPQECVLWPLGKNWCGYGKVKRNRRTEAAHRVAYLFYYGGYPTQEACHACDNRCCINPTHLFDGTRLDNQRDMAVKGRAAKGSANGNSVLSEMAVIAIRAAYRNGLAHDLAREYGVCRATIFNIVKRRHWKHI